MFGVSSAANEFYDSVDNKHIKPRTLCARTPNPPRQLAHAFGIIAQAAAPGLALICNHFRGQSFLFMREVQHGTHKKEKLRPIHPGLQASGR